VGSETTGSQSETAAINNRGSRGLKKEARCGDADEWAPPGLDIFKTNFTPLQTLKFKPDAFPSPKNTQTLHEARAEYSKQLLRLGQL
jgi:hypothetical protein